MTDAERATEEYFARMRLVGRTRFDPKGAQKEYDPALPKVRFYRFADNSVARFEKGDVQPS